MSATLPISTSLAMATPLRLSSAPLVNPRSRYSSDLLKPISPPSFPTLRFSRSTGFPFARPLVGSFYGRELGFVVRAAGNGGGGEPSSERADVTEAEEARRQSTMPERFRYLTKEAPDRAVRWPWIIALFFLVYCWRTVLWELSNWKKAVLVILNFFGYISKLALAIIFHFIGDPITGLIRCVEFSLYVVRYIYSSIVAFAPVPELTRIILLTSTVLSIAEVTVPNSVNSQPYLLSMAGVIAFGAVNGFVPEVLFWLLLSGMFCYSYFIKKRDGVSAALPSAAVLAAVGEPWVRGLTIASYLAVAIIQNSKASSEGLKAEATLNTRKLPLPLLLSALSIGIHVAAKWVRYRHLTWMIA